MAFKRDLLHPKVDHSQADNIAQAHYPDHSNCRDNQCTTFKLKWQSLKIQDIWSRINKSHCICWPATSWSKLKIKNYHSAKKSIKLFTPSPVPKSKVSKYPSWQEVSPLPGSTQSQPRSPHAIITGLRREDFNLSKRLTRPRVNLVNATAIFN